ncbi:hypothetical protein BKK79_00175 [Cupriavidus sp. USMAA2-4]|uniref:Response regulatory domain-containing protein n=1 Tax=Cupriavidus malaysiensis TaxID=367825 RepID=A0ABN4TPA5_9BURK|nr:MULTISPECIES: excisionase family DNA-binding protein [Cupriavidus]AOY90416.1 hypothetical protein BKK79_00175 [Cupriavidus sp. USMAA2-4]AOY99895.1 hypothetical protein BKK81_12055 [Cupriavidus sp. USMAHM13]AOZ06531.1 hypothetical protein BKK80_12400 [Cupriavidus malaysiensis]
MSKNFEFYSTQEAAERLGVSRRTVQMWVETGKLPAWKTDGGHRRIPKEAVDTLVLQQQRVQDGSLLRSRRLMIIESDPYLRDLYASGIRTRFPDLKIESVGNGIEGLIAIGRCEPDILILDLVMPGVDGFRLLHTLKTNEIYEKIAIIIVTGLSDDVIESNGGLPEHICLLKKPIGVKELPIAVNNALTSRQVHLAA